MDGLRGPHFINVDLEVWSDSDLAPFQEAVQAIAFVLYAGKIRRRFLVSLEARAPKANSPEGRIWALLKIVDALPPAARRAWKAARSRIFDVGYQGGEFVTLLRERPLGSGRWYAADPGHAVRPCETSFSPEVLAAVAKVGGTIATTIYPPTREVPSRRKKTIPR
ncbi:MAG TPA: hypothetical protein VN962_12315 [Polyangia bacterium]|nr:hypothetical protein [Polyangia bacterium]